MTMRAWILKHIEAGSWWVELLLFAAAAIGVGIGIGILTMLVAIGAVPFIKFTEWLLG